MASVQRVLDAEPVTTLAHYVEAGGGRALEAARRLGPAGIVEELEASGLRGRGGAGFPTGTKWRAVIEHRSPAVPPTVVVNGAEGEPGSFKDRAILRHNPYRVLEGALVAATAVGADRVVVGLKASFTPEVDRVRRAIAEVAEAGWSEGVELGVVEGPGAYLYGEETALLEVIDGREPFPRIAPPFRQGVDDVGDDTASAAGVDMAAPGDETAAPPTLVNNVETLAHAALILAESPDWFRELGTSESPGTIVCTVSGRTRRHGVGEVAMGTPLRDIVEEIGGGPVAGRVAAVMSGVSHPLLPGSMLDAPASFEGLDAVGSGLGAAGFIVFDDASDLVAVARGVSRFLAVESCGQCQPCKQDGLAIADLLDQLCRSNASDGDVDHLHDRLATVAEGARCYLAHQHERVVASVLRLFPDAVQARLAPDAEPVEPELITPIIDIDDGKVVLDEQQAAKQPDWTYDEEYSGESPADRIDQRTPAPDE